MVCSKPTLLAVVLLAAAILYQYYKPEGLPKIHYGSKNLKEDGAGKEDNQKRIAIGLVKKIRIL